MRGVPDGEGRGPEKETLEAYDDAYLARLQASRQRWDPDSSPVVLRVEGTFQGGILRVTVAAQPLAALDGTRLALRLVVVQDPIHHVAEGGTEVHRFVAVQAPHSWEFVADGQPMTRGHNVTRLGTGSIEDVGVVVYVEALEPGPAGLVPQEVLQATWWTPVSGTSVTQASKAVLVEARVATHCAECGPANAALGELMARYGPQDASSDDAFRYVPHSDWTVWAIGGLGGLVTTFALLPRRRPETPRRGPRV